MEENKVMNIELTPEMFEKLDDSKKNSEKIAYESKHILQMLGIVSRKIN